MATENNYLNHTQKRDRAEAMAACADKACRDKVRAEYAAEWEKNKREVTDCSTQSECLTLARDLRLEQQAQGERMAELQEKGPGNWSDAEKAEYADLRFGDASLNQLRTVAIANANKLAGDQPMDRKRSPGWWRMWGLGRQRGSGLVGRPINIPRTPVGLTI
ncbi:hypothetical protein [Cupriavidus pauculus]|uniref:Uncharacterized protein n=1 Tax=Cupriavidus pauculus TaxID=82633 RepID=A0A3G8GZH3_9BURK|nr:hypothetical protein [Cupriavidus pauculus]AZG12702.1 hypothetical protein EHF44_04215 [Cupriavidus pauculus]